MQYRTLGKTGLEVSALGFGLMRLPVIDGKDDAIDEPKAIEMIRHAIDQGVNYVDSAYVYHGGSSEKLIGKALADGYREKVILATKLPVWDVKSIEDADRILNEQLARCQTNTIDCYLLHCLTVDRWPAVRDLGITDWLLRAQADGRIGKIGFSFHDKLDVFKEIVEAFDWDFCQIQYNFMNEDVQAGTEGLQYAAARNLGVVIMEPLFGGTLVGGPDEVMAIWKEGGKINGVDSALKWLWNKPEVSLVLSGMGTMEQVVQNLASADASGVGLMSEADQALVARVREAYKSFAPVPCTKCHYCMPCPNGVDIPGVFELYNNGVILQGSSLGLSKGLYKLMPESARADRCSACGACEDKCPQQIRVSEEMPKVHEGLS